MLIREFEFDGTASFSGEVVELFSNLSYSPTVNADVREKLHPNPVSPELVEDGGVSHGDPACSRAVVEDAAHVQVDVESRGEVESSGLIYLRSWPAAWLHRPPSEPWRAVEDGLLGWSRLRRRCGAGCDRSLHRWRASGLLWHSDEQLTKHWWWLHCALFDWWYPAKWPCPLGLKKASWRSLCWLLRLLRLRLLRLRESLRRRSGDCWGL